MAKKKQISPDNFALPQNDTPNGLINIEEAKNISFFEKMGNKAAVTASIILLLGLGCGAGIWQQNIQLGTEIRELKTVHSKEISNYINDIADLKAKIRELNFLRKQDSIRINSNGNESKKQ